MKLTAKIRLNLISMSVTQVPTGIMSVKATVCIKTVFFQMHSSLHIPTQINNRNNPPHHKKINAQYFTYSQYVTNIKLKQK